MAVVIEPPSDFPSISLGLEAMREWLDSRDFYELCQAYRHSHEPTTVQAFEALKSAIADQFAEHQ